jgi:hypothetical protein
MLSILQKDGRFKRLAIHLENKRLEKKYWKCLTKDFLNDIFIKHVEA